jgi:DNA invertase Pin-like site-specific DNA recombinase
MTRHATPPPAPAAAKFLVAYYRVSTVRQGEFGFGLDAQRDAVRGYAARTGATIVAEYQEEMSGRRRDRPELAIALAVARARGAVLVVAKLDRLARDAGFVIDLMRRGVPMTFLDYPAFDATTALGRMMLTMAAGMAQYESERTGERIRDGLAVKRAKYGPTKLTQRQRRKARAASAKGGAAWTGTTAAHRKRYGPVIRATRRSAATNGAAAAALNAAGVPTLSGRPWTAANLSRFLHAGE